MNRSAGIFVAVPLGLVVGYFAGREHLKYEMRTALTSAAEGFSEGLSSAFGGNTIAEEDYQPVLASNYSVSGKNAPLKPGYIWQMEKNKFYSAKQVPSEWKEGSIEAAITDIRFTEQ